MVMLLTCNKYSEIIFFLGLYLHMGAHWALDGKMCSLPPSHKLRSPLS